MPRATGIGKHDGDESAHELEQRLKVVQAVPRFGRMGHGIAGTILDLGQQLSLGERPAVAQLDVLLLFERRLK